jgi:hypothetical protein
VGDEKREMENSVKSSSHRFIDKTRV